MIGAGVEARQQGLQARAFAVFVGFAQRAHRVVQEFVGQRLRQVFDHGFASTTVPMMGAADSRNVSVCASILLYAARARASGWYGVATA